MKPVYTNANSSASNIKPTLDNCAAPASASALVLFSLLCALAVFCLLCIVSVNVSASPPNDEVELPYTPPQTSNTPVKQTLITDCDNLLAFRLSLNEGGQGGALADCNVTTFDATPTLAAFDCTGLTANMCASLYRTNLPHTYMQGGWNPNNELWYLPLERDVAGGNLCLDGTRQLVYADKAVAWACSNNGNSCETNVDCGAGACAANDIESDEWVFYTQGGNNCLTEQSCLDHYMQGEVTTTTRAAPFGHNGEGILSDDPRNPFHGHNRVRLRKCNRDGFTGNITRPSAPLEARPSALWENQHVEFDLHFHGYRQWLATFEQLRNGYADHREFYGSCAVNADCQAGDQCITSVNDANVFMCATSKTLPALSEASSILLTGWSGGATALSHTGDSLVEQLRTGAQPLAPNASVRLGFDAAWKPGLESDTAFMQGHKNMYLVSDDEIPTDDAPGLLPDDADAAIENGADAGFSNGTYVEGGYNFNSHELWGIQYDESCVTIHGWNNWHCHERHHVLANHVASPSFTRTAQRDAKGLDQPSSSHYHSTEPCKAEPSEFNCYDWVDEEYRQRIFEQSANFFGDYSTLSEEGAGTPARGVYAPNQTKHSGFEDANQFLNVTLMQCLENGTEARAMTLGQAMYGWIATGNRIGAIEYREGEAAGNGYLWVDKNVCGTCPHVPAAANFAADNDLSEWDLSVCN